MVEGFRSEPLDPARHDLVDFDSGQPELDGWLRDHPAGAQARRVGRTFVWRREGTEVVGYYCLSAHRLARGEMPPAVGHGSPVEVPAVLLGRLALDRSLQGQGLGAALLADAMGRVVAATAIVAARVVVVDAIDEAAASFYAHHGVPARARNVAPGTEGQRRRGGS